MGSCEELERASAVLRSVICNFPIGAVTLRDFEPIDVKIRDTRTRIKCLMSRINLVRALNETRTIRETHPESLKQLEKTMHETISSQYVHKYKILKNSQQSKAAETILSDAPQIPPEMSRELKAVMHKLYSQNDKIIALQEEMEKLHTQERQLQTDVAESIFDFQDFLKEQEQIRNERLVESNPEIAKKKKKLKMLITKINISRRIITSLISATSATISGEPDLLRMLKDYRDLVNAETIMETAQNRES